VTTHFEFGELLVRVASLVDSRAGDWRPRCSHRRWAKTGPRNRFIGLRTWFVPEEAKSATSNIPLTIST